MKQKGEGTIICLDKKNSIGYGVYGALLKVLYTSRRVVYHRCCHFWCIEIADILLQRWNMSLSLDNTPSKYPIASAFPFLQISKYVNLICYFERDEKIRTFLGKEPERVPGKRLSYFKVPWNPIFFCISTASQKLKYPALLTEIHFLFRRKNSSKEFFPTII